MNAPTNASLNASGNASAPLSRAAQLRRMLTSSQLEFIMEAHNGVSAKIVEEAGFKGIWASGLTMSAQFGVRDNNEASWTQVVDMLEFMSDASSLPILLDGDTGYGNFNNFRRLIHKLEQRSIAGVCIEDKLFPKTNSFIDGDRQPLADVDEFCGKIKAGKDSQSDPDFSIVARVEALISGWGMDEALRRAEAYHRAGADAILIHSKRAKADEIVTFAKEWADRCPLVIVPTKYYSTPTDVFRRANISLIIWANHLLRASIPAMQATAKEIHDSETLIEIEDRVTTVDEIFRLQGADEYSAAEKRYFAPSRPAPRAVVLAASRGDGLESLTLDKPKVMLPVGGKPLMRWLVDAFKKEAINEITVVAGYKAEAIDTPGIKKVLNAQYANSGELVSLAAAADAGPLFESDLFVTYGDLLFRQYILKDLLQQDAEICVVVDSSQADSGTDLAWCSAPDDRGLFGQNVSLRHIGNVPTGAQAPAAATGAPSGRWIGMLSVRGEGRAKVKAVLGTLRERADFSTLGMPALLNALTETGHAVRVLYVHGHWRGVNDLEDFRRAGEFAHGQQPIGSVSASDARGTDHA
ncbi:phosphoenolpyruvate mutase [Robbsia sp. KACC 23696]|uniref:phosphoenolpyruvate mutase n=1 Tax=Robbsia sp. KACC 23696 TaxID=3149231 RepID=UPI00325BC5F8